MPGRLDQIESMLRARLGSALLASCPELVYAVSGILFRFLRTSDSLSALWRQMDSTLFNTVFQATGGRMRVTLDDGRSILATGEMLRDLADRLLALAYRRMDVSPTLTDALYDLSRAGSFAAMRELFRASRWMKTSARGSCRCSKRTGRRNNLGDIMAKIIAITNQKGGVGKTTTSVNLSACVAAEGKRVLVVDADPQGNTSSGLGVRVKEKTPTVYEVMAGETEIGQALCKTAVKGLTVLPADIRLAGAEIELANMEHRERVVADMLEGVRDRFDYIFIDCPPSLGMITLNALCAADGVLIPIQCEYFALEGVSALMGTVQKVQKMNRHLAIEGVVLTMLDARTNLGVQVAQEVRKVFKNKVYQTVIPRNVRLGEAPSHGLPISLYDPRSLGAQSYQQLAKEFLARE